jgi:molybdopterin synthase catalytic subunit
MTIDVLLTKSPINISDIMQRVQSNDHGAIDLFIGTVRNSHQGKSVTGITYDAHASLATKTFTDICKKAQAQWPESRLALTHFVGALPVGGISIAIAVSTPHRAESFEACRFVIEEIKKYAPIWKQEHYTDGKSAWLPGHSLRSSA